VTLLSKIRLIYKTTIEKGLSEETGKRIKSDFNPGISVLSQGGWGPSMEKRKVAKNRAAHKTKRRRAILWVKISSVGQMIL